VDNALSCFRATYNQDPKRGWQWGNYLYLEAPAKDGGADERK
jgi:hypothetical protein